MSDNKAGMPQRVARKLSLALDDPHIRDLLRMTVLCCAVGLVAGLGAVAFQCLLQAGREACMGYLANYHPVNPGFQKPVFDFGTWAKDGSIVRWMLLILPAIGGLLSGLIVFHFAPEAEGHGTDAAIEAYHYRDGFVRARVPLIKTIASLLTIGSGGSAGKEGPIAQIGSGFGSVLGQWLKLPPHQRRLLMAAGMGGGIGAIFHAPLAGAIFAAEVMYSGPDFEHEILVPAFASSIVAYSMFGTVFGFHPLFDTPPYIFNNPMVLLPYLILILVVAAGAILYVRTFYGVRTLMFDKVKRVPNALKPAIGGLAVGIIGFFIPEALGTGYGVVQVCFNGDAGALPDLTSLPSAAFLAHGWAKHASPALIGAMVMALIGLTKIVTTAFTVGSGGSGGVFGPAIVIGGALGGATGLTCAHLFPSLPIHPGAFALVGMAGFFAGAAKTPVSTIIMVSEITGNYDLLLPSMLVCIGSFALCRRHNLYNKQLSSRLLAPSKLGNMAVVILQQLSVRQAIVDDCSCVVVKETDNLQELMRRFAQSRQDCFPVVNEKQELTGMIDVDHIRRMIANADMAPLIIGADIEVSAVTITPDDSLLAAVNRMVVAGTDELVIVDGAPPLHIIGTLSRSDILAAYNRQILTVPSPPKE